MTESTKNPLPYQDPVRFYEAAAMLAIPQAELALAVLHGRLRFRIFRTTRLKAVGCSDIEFSRADVMRFGQERHGDPELQEVLADSRINRAALKYGLHPIRTGRGVRGPRRDLTSRQTEASLNENTRSATPEENITMSKNSGSGTADIPADAETARKAEEIRAAEGHTAVEKVETPLPGQS